MNEENLCDNTPNLVRNRYVNSNSAQNIELPEGDRTPAGFVLPRVSLTERIKRPMRRLIYPPYNLITSALLRRKYATSLPIDQWLWGQRGNDFERLRGIVNRFCPLRGKRLLIIGCGTGRDLPSWLAFGPRTLTAIDYFRYDRAWNFLRAQAKRAFPRTELEFMQADASHLPGLEDESYDVVGSDAVFEHVRNVPAMLRELHRIIRSGGVLYATFGPLWYSWGGDHVSGFDRLECGYNHLLLSPEEYDRYLDQLGAHYHSENDGRTWLRHGLFSRLRSCEYLRALEGAGFRRLFVRVIVDPRAVRCLRRNPLLRATLLSRADEFDLVVTGMTVVYRK